LIKDRVLLGAIAGFAGNLAKTAIDEISLRMKISQRSFRATAAGLWLPSAREANSLKGQILGSALDSGMGILGGIGTVQLLTVTGRDQIIVKGIVSGVALGSAITSLMSGSKNNKVRPKDAASNLSYMLSHAAYGLVTTYVAAKLGDASLFMEKPLRSALNRLVANNKK
jgi:hypothetical protein